MPRKRIGPRRFGRRPLTGGRECGTMRFSPMLALHICSGVLGFLSGAAAISFRKGSRNHGLAGKIFVITMLSLAASGVYLAVAKSQPNHGSANPCETKWRRH